MSTAPDEPGTPLSRQLDLAGAAQLLSSIDREPADEQRDHSMPRMRGYVLTRRLGGGGGGDVYHGYRVGSDRPVIVKVLKSNRDTDPESRRAWRELDVLSQLHLSCAPRVLDYGVHEGHVFIVSEYVDGKRLDDYCDQQDLDVRQRVATLAKVAHAVQSLHEHGVIHRDIKPANILIDSSGNPTIIDLGLATSVAGSMTTITAEGRPIGTPAYMAPEQAAGDRQRMSTRTDVYGLGATAYSILTGHTPHDVDTTLHEAVRRVAQDEPREPRSLKPKLSRPLARVLFHCCSRNPADRYASADQLASDLERWLAGEPVTPGRRTAWDRFINVVRRHPIAATATLCGVMIAGTISFTALSVQWWNSQAIRLELEDGRRAALFARSGRVVHWWERQEASRPWNFASMVKRQDTRREDLVLFAYGHSPGNDHPSQLVAFRAADDRDTPVWSSAIGQNDLLPIHSDRKFSGRDFAPRFVAIDDYFPTRPGAEALVVFQHQVVSACALRIVDIGDGSTLFQLWHDGNITSSYWMSGAQLLVLTARHGGEYWKHSDYDGESTPAPWIVFGVTPKLSSPSHAYAGVEPGNDSTHIEWYKCVLPPDNVALVRLAPWVARAERAHQARLSIEFNPVGSTEWYIDDAGDEVASQRIVSDQLKKAGTIEWAHELFLAPWPPEPDAN